MSYTPSPLSLTSIEQPVALFAGQCTWRLNQLVPGPVSRMLMPFDSQQQSWSAELCPLYFKYCCFGGRG